MIFWYGADNFSPVAYFESCVLLTGGTNDKQAKLCIDKERDQRTWMNASQT